MSTSTAGDGDALIAFYPVTDLEVVRRFFGETLELPLVRDQGSCLIFAVGVGGGYLGFCRHDTLPGAGGARHPGLILTLVTERVDDLYRRLSEGGVVTEGAPRWNERYGIYHFFARGPDGYRLEIQRFRDPLPRPAPG